MTLSAVVYNEEDNLIVSSFDSMPAEAKLGSFWMDESLEGIKDRIKSYYIAAQSVRCCYCNRHLATHNHRLWDVEHIVSRAGHPQFMFIPNNLAASCPDCNRLKGDQSSLKNKNRKTYPSKSDDFVIVHPHFDEYVEHIHCDQFVYLPKTAKGKKTIYICDLLRFAQLFIDWKNSAADSTFEAEVDAVMQGGANAPAAVDKIIQSIG